MPISAALALLVQTAAPGPQEHVWRFRTPEGVEAVVSELVEAGAPAVRLRYHDGEERLLDLAALDAALAPDEDGAWLADVPRPVRLRKAAAYETGEAYLDLATRAGLLAVDVRDGTCFRAGALGQTRRIDLRFDGAAGFEGNVDQPYVDSIAIAPAFEHDAPVVVELEGHHPTPGWGIVGYGLEVGEAREGAPRRLLVTPLAVAPSGFAHAQVLDPFTSRLELLHLPPGEYALEVVTKDGTARAPEPFVVRPPRLVCALDASGGLLGLHERTELYENGWARLVDRRSPRKGRGGERSLWVQPMKRDRIEELLGRLPTHSREQLDASAADLVTYELEWRVRAGERYTLRVDDVTADGFERELFAALTELL